MATLIERGAKAFRRLAAELGKLDGELDEHKSLFEEVARRRWAVRVTPTELTRDRQVGHYSDRFKKLAEQAGKLFLRFTHIPSWPQVSSMPVGGDLVPSAFWLLALEATAKDPMRDPASLADTGIPGEYLGQARNEIIYAVCMTERDDLIRQLGKASPAELPDLYWSGHFAHYGHQLAVASGRACDYLADLLEPSDGATPQQPRRRRGRPRDPKVETRNRQMWEAWQTTEYKTYRALGEAFRVSEDVARKAVTALRRRHRQ